MELEDEFPSVVGGGTNDYIGNHYSVQLVDSNIYIVLVIGRIASWQWKNKLCLEC